MPIILNSKVIFLVIFFYLFYLFPISLNAQIIITEIMYNPEGTDSGREWVEIYNSGAETVDLSGYKLLENEVNHRLSEYETDGFLLETNKYAIIADNPTKFLVDFPTKAGLLIDSAFSLNNTGEEISIIDSNDQTTDSVNYLPEDWGANGTGNSLQLKDLKDNNRNNWIPADPTPWKVNKTEAENESADTDSNSTPNDSSSSSVSSSTSSNSSSVSDSSHSAVNDLSNYKPKIDLKISAGRDRYVLVNTPIEFYIQHNQDSDDNLKAKWSMGDGNIEKGTKIRYSYSSPGTYNLVLNAETDDQKATSRSKVYVNQPEIDLTYSISGETVDIMLENKTSQEVNIGGFYLKFNDKSFNIAPDTIIDSQKNLNISHKITGFSLKDDDIDKNKIKNQKIRLYYPNGEEITETSLVLEYLILNHKKISKLIN